ncbi:MAG: winged helix DNA-binding protein, partial [Clostridia bacterium]|nr:winged helix DNA-binding protein [Clostridia bacterium]
MLTESLSRVMLRMRLGFLRKMFITVREESQDLTPMEIFCLECIETMERPTISQFARFTGISQSNATYRVNCLIRKGYVNRVPSEKYRREVHLELTDKFMGCGPVFEQSCRVL